MQKYNSRTRAAGGQQWHRQRIKNPGISVVGIDKPEWIDKENIPVESLQDKQAMKDKVRREMESIDPEMITVCKAGKRTKRGK